MMFASSPNLEAGVHKQRRYIIIRRPQHAFSSSIAPQYKQDHISEVEGSAFSRVGLNIAANASFAV